MTNPEALLRRVLWSCNREVYADAAAFDAAIRKYYRDLDVDLERWRGDDLVLAAPRVHVQFMCWENDDQVEPRLLLEASDPAGFTALDLLSQTHNAVARYLREHDATLGDHRFFEGLSAAAGDREVPLYFVDFGS
ncbi:MAG: hypothetical protein KC486_24995 [Myxococcales bacterium]|nr:hypothetical protein [Myxococcales bacterium]